MFTRPLSYCAATLMLTLLASTPALAQTPLPWNQPQQAPTGYPPAPDQYPPSQYPPAQYPPSQYPSEQYPPSQYPSAQYAPPPPQYPPQQYPSPQYAPPPPPYPPAQYPSQQYPAPRPMQPQPYPPQAYAPAMDPQEQREQDDRKLNALADEYYAIGEKTINGPQKLASLEKRVKSYRQILTSRPYDSADIKKDAASLIRRIDAKEKKLASLEAQTQPAPPPSK